MSVKSDNDRPASRLVSATGRIPPVEVDCSDCDPDVPADPRPGSRLVSAVERFAPVVTDCSEWDPLLVVWLELRVPVDALADPAVVEAATVRLIHAAAAAAPELGLTYDKSRSGVEGREVVVALTPTNPVGAEDRLAEIARTIEAGQAAGRPTAAWRKAG